VTANVAPALCASLHSAWDTGELARFAQLRDLLDPLHSALFVESNPIPLKAALAELSLSTDELRLPLTRATPATRDRLVQVMAGIIPAEEEAVPTRLASSGRRRVSFAFDVPATAMTLRAP
jgi:4-hydroxy-tetrahydrodipicolinate synthase